MPCAVPRVTVIVPTYNWSAVLPFSIGSARAQTFDDYELLVVGDGCTDDSAAVVAAIGDPRVRWVNLPSNSGHQSAANNEGLRLARGEIVAYLGHDDLWLPHHLACLVAAIDAGADMAFGLVRMVPPEPEMQRAALMERFVPQSWVAPTATAHRRALTERLGGWSHYRGLAVDPETELWSRFHAAGARIEAVKRLSAVKFPASARRGVYRERPCHEQAAWFARIEREPDFEAVELARMASEMATAALEPPFGTLIRQVLRRGARAAVRRLRLPASGSRPGEAIERRRRLKGLAPAVNAHGGKA